MAVQPTSLAEEKTRIGRGGVTLKDVAARASVSTGVASTVLSGGNTNIRVAVETQSRVREAARALGYRSRRGSLSLEPLSALQDGRAKSIATPPQPASLVVGVIASFNPDRSNHEAAYDPWEHEITTGLELALNQSVAQSVVQYCNRGRHGSLPLPLNEAVSQLQARGVDALALIEISSAQSEIARCILLLESTNLPFVLVTTDPLTAPVANVYFDSVNGGYRAASHLVEQNYKEIVFLSPVRSDWADERIAGAREALHYAGHPDTAMRVFPPEAERVALPPFDVRIRQWEHGVSGYEAGKLLLDREGTPPVALIAANDATALGFIRAAEERGFRAGVDFAIVGYDDAPSARQHNLTSLRPPREEMGREAVRLLLRQIAGDASARQQIRLNMHLMVRGSTPPASLIASRRREE